MKSLTITLTLTALVCAAMAISVPTATDEQLLAQGCYTGERSTED